MAAEPRPPPKATRNSRSFLSRRALCWREFRCSALPLSACASGAPELIGNVARRLSAFCFSRALYLFSEAIKVVDVRRLLLTFAFVCSSAFANSSGEMDAPDDFSITVDAGRLRVSNTAPLPHVDATAPFLNGSLLLIIAANGDGTFSSTLSPGNFISDNDILLAAGGFNNSGGLDETITFFSVPTTGLTLPPNDRIALRWFPDITYAQYLSGTKPSGGQHFGTYNPRTSVPPNATDNPDGGDPWTTPLSGSIALNFFTTDSGGGGTQQPSEGYASSIVSGSPTPHHANPNPNPNTAR